LRRVEPVVAGLAGLGVEISVDTSKAAVAAAALDAGATIVNDVTALRGDPEMPALVADRGAGVVLMHMAGDPRTMQVSPEYGDVVAEVRHFLAARLEAAVDAGVDESRIWLDPGIGFGKTLQHNLALLAHLDRLTALGFRTLVGASRKRFIRILDASAIQASDRLGGSIAAALNGAEAGVDAVRAHDVRETVQAFKVWAAMRDAR
jgi:dihydropteroate synthase